MRIIRILIGDVMKSRDLPAPSDKGPLPATTDGTTHPPSGVRTWTSSVLLGDAQTAVIVHAGRHYQLRRTRNGKLILT